MRAKGAGAHVIVCEVNPLRALEAVMDGYTVRPALDAAREGDVFITVTGDRDVLRREHFEAMRDGAILANAGHFNDEIDLRTLGELAKEKEELRPFVDEYRLQDGRRVVVLGEGRLVNLAAAEGHPPAVMDMSFANQALSVEYLTKQGKDLAPQVYAVPRELDEQIARKKLAAMGMRIDTMTTEQAEYARSWKAGT